MREEFKRGGELPLNPLHAGTGHQLSTLHEQDDRKNRDPHLLFHEKPQEKERRLMPLIITQSVAKSVHLGERVADTIQRRHEKTRPKPVVLDLSNN